MTKMNIVFLFAFFLFASCGKQHNEPDWSFCDGCPNSAWAGEYVGAGAFYSRSNPDVTEEVPLAITINELPDFRLKIEVNSPNKFYASYNGVKDDSVYYFDMAGSEKSIHLNLHKKENDFKLTGNAKTYIIVNDTVVLNRSVSFEILKNR